MSGEGDLFGDDEGLDEDAPSPFSGAAADEVRARIGRPRGARNRKSRDFERWYQAKGYVDPLQRLAELVSEDPRVLTAWFDENAGVDARGRKRAGPSILEVVRMQISAAEALAPYLHGKKPVKVEVVGDQLPMLMLALGTNQLAEAEAIEQRKALSAGAPLVEGEASEIKDLGEDE